MQVSLVSIVLPTYNRAHLIRRAVDSVLNQQGNTTWELLVIDDGSSDNTDEVIRAYADPRIHYHKMDMNRGQSAAMNRGIELAQGELITFLDSDDEYYPTRLEKQVAVFSTSTVDNLGVVTCGRTDIDHRGKEYFTWSPSLRGNILKPLLAGQRIGGGPPFLMVKREVVERGIRFDETLKSVKELDFLIQVFLAGYGLDFVPEPLLKVYHGEEVRTFNYRNATITRLAMLTRYAAVFEERQTKINYLYRTYLYAILSGDRSIIDQTAVALRAAGEGLGVSAWRLIPYLRIGKVKNAYIKLLSQWYIR